MGPLGISGIVLAIIGTILTIIGVFLLIFNQNNTSWYMWLLFLGGFVLAVIGAILLGISFSKNINKMVSN